MTNDDPYSKTSYRQKGKRASGSLIKGTASAAFMKKSMGSVPTKFKTLVYMQNETK